MSWGENPGSKLPGRWEGGDGGRGGDGGGDVGSARGQGRVIFEGKSEFNDRIIVREDEKGIRRLLFAENAPAQTVMDMREPERLVGAYSRVIMVSLGVVERPRRMLVVGLGGGAMPMFLRRNCPEAEIDIAELDPGVVEAAKGYFGFKEDERMKVFVGDGRKFIETVEKKYDIIYLDAFGADSMPRALATKEFMEAVKGRLSEGGVVASNVWASGSGKLYASMVRTYEAVFGELHIIRVPLSESRIHLAFAKGVGLSKAGLMERVGGVEGRLRPRLALRFLVESGYVEVGRVKGGEVLRDGEGEIGK
ncbi:MAG: fused MFS/spermidine synthase [Planctomycetota bacterium]|nr:fused MFS/spermidine synthase [Planctomycetota bacterium]